jgi:hypothetical protein
MEIKTAEYHVWENEGASTIHLEGTMRLSGTPAYDAISKLMEDRLATNPPSLTLDLTRLELLNSSGINLLAKFTIRARTANLANFVVKGTSAYPWQSKSLANLVRLYPKLKLQVE